MSTLLYSGQNNPKKHQKSTTQKILILSSNGGGGHSSAAYAIKKYLKKNAQYEIIINNIIAESFSIIDPFRYMSFGYKSCEDFYNYCLQKNWTRAANNLYKLDAFFQPYAEPVFDKIIDGYIKKEKPDLIISVIPLLNGCIARIAKKHALPFAIVPTDLDASLFMFGMQEPYSSKVKLCLSYKNDDIINTLHGSSITSHNIHTGGFPIRPDFFEEKNKEQIKKDFNIPENKPVILLLMGAAGSDKICKYVQILKEMPQSAHIVICLGRLESLRSTLQTMSFSPNITTTIVSHTPRMSDLMAIADVGIIKPGSVSVNEALYMNLPTIIDNIGEPLVWEKFNIDFIEQNNFGSILNSFDELQKIVSDYISDKNFCKNISETIAQFSKEQFGDHIQNLVHSMLENKQLNTAPNYEHHAQQKEP